MLVLSASSSITQMYVRVILRIDQRRLSAGLVTFVAGCREYIARVTLSLAALCLFGCMVIAQSPEIVWSPNTLEELQRLRNGPCTGVVSVGARFLGITSSVLSEFATAIRLMNRLIGRLLESS